MGHGAKFLTRYYAMGFARLTETETIPLISNDLCSVVFTCFFGCILLRIKHISIQIIRHVDDEVFTINILPENSIH